MMQADDDLLQDARLLLAQRDLPAAVAAFDRAEAFGAAADDCAGGRWMAHMLAGQLSSAWHESDAIRRRGAPDPHRFWAGEELTGKRVIVRCLHGYGDAVQFLRYAPRLRAIASHLIVEVAPQMVEVARCLDGVEDVITWGADAPACPPQWDVQVEVMELPYLFRTHAAELPLAVNYLRLPSIPHPDMPAQRGVGLVWAAGRWNAERSIPFALLQPLLQIPGCTFWNLQGGSEREQWRGSVRCGDGIMALASSIARLDLIITVDTLAAHLAGALGKAAWVLLPWAADWRWMIKGDRSPWYPSLRLFRQPLPGDWESTIDAVQQELQQWVAQKAA